MNTEGIPSCEWPDAKRPATFRNCCDKDGRLDKNLETSRSREPNRGDYKAARLSHGLTNKKRRALANERQRLERMFNLGKYSPVPVGEIDERKDKATEKKLRWLGKKKDDQANLQESDVRA